MDRRLGGDISGPGGPHDPGGVVFDSTGALIPYSVVCAQLDAEGDPAEVRGGQRPEGFVAGILLEGRINRTTERTKVLVLAGPDAVAAILSELLALIGRAGKPEVVEAARERLDALAAEGLDRPGP